MERMFNFDSTDSAENNKKQSPVGKAFGDAHNKLNDWAYELMVGKKPTADEEKKKKGKEEYRRKYKEALDLLREGRKDEAIKILKELRKKLDSEDDSKVYKEKEKLEKLIEEIPTLDKEKIYSYWKKEQEN